MLEDYKGSESDTLNSHSQQALFSFNSDGGADDDDDDDDAELPE